MQNKHSVATSSIQKILQNKKNKKIERSASTTNRPHQSNLPQPPRHPHKIQATNPTPSPNPPPPTASRKSGKNRDRQDSNRRQTTTKSPRTSREKRLTDSSRGGDRAARARAPFSRHGGGRRRQGRGKETLARGEWGVVVARGGKVEEGGRRRGAWRKVGR